MQRLPKSCARGLAVLVREGSAAKNLSVLVNGLLDSDLPADRFLFCTDDKHLDDIARDGHLRWNVRQAISLGMKPVTAIKMATWNAAREYGLRDLGAVAAGYRADLVLLDSLKQMTVRAVYKDGRPVEERFAGLAAAPYPMRCCIRYTLRTWLLPTLRCLSRARPMSLRWCRTRSSRGTQWRRFLRKTAFSGPTPFIPNYAWWNATAKTGALPFAR